MNGKTFAILVIVCCLGYSLGTGKSEKSQKKIDDIVNAKQYVLGQCKNPDTVSFERVKVFDDFISLTITAKNDLGVTKKDTFRYER